MDVNPHHQNKIYKFCRYLTKHKYDEDYRDLAHDVFMKLLAMEAPKTINDGWLFTVCNSQWRDRIRHKNLTRDEGHLMNMISAFIAPEKVNDAIANLSPVLPDQEVLFAAKEAGIELDDWPTYYKARRPANRPRDRSLGLERLEIYNNLFR